MSLVGTSRQASGAVLHLVLGGEKGNVLTGALLRELDAALAEHAADAHLKLVLLQGAGRHFSFGASVEEHRKDKVREMLATFHATIRRVLSYPVATAALVQGKCLGGAFELALACNFVVATDDAHFACPEISLGVLPPVLAALGPLRLGCAWTDRLVLGGGALDAHAADSLGFVTERVPAGAEPLAHALAWHERTLAKHSAYALRQALEATRAASGSIERVSRAIADVERLYLERVVPSADGNEGIEAFLAKRSPKWVDA